MYQVRSRGGGGHPGEVGHDAGILLEAFPAGGVLCPYDGGVVLRAEPRPEVVVRHALNVALPLLEALAFAVL